MINPLKNLSPSSIGTLKQCPRRFKLSKIDKIPEVSGEEALMGSMVHNILEVLLKEPKENRTIAEAKKIATRLWNAKWDAETSLVKNKNSFRWQVWWCIENYFGMEDPTTIEPGGLEHWLRSKVNGVPMVGIVDRWTASENGITITDYKTGKIPRKIEWLADKVLQLDIYEIMAGESIGPVNTMEFLYLKSGERATYSPDPERRASAISIITEAWEEVERRCEKEDFPAIKSVLCDWCSYKSDCPAWT